MVTATRRTREDQKVVFLAMLRAARFGIHKDDRVPCLGSMVNVQGGRALCPSLHAGSMTPEMLGGHWKAVRSARRGSVLKLAGRQLHGGRGATNGWPTPAGRTPGGLNAAAGRKRGDHISLHAWTSLLGPRARAMLRIAAKQIHTCALDVLAC